MLGFTRRYAKENSLSMALTRSTLACNTTYKGGLAYSNTSALKIVSFRVDHSCEKVSLTFKAFVKATMLKECLSQALTLSKNLVQLSTGIRCGHLVCITPADSRLPPTALGRLEAAKNRT